MPWKQVAVAARRYRRQHGVEVADEEQDVALGVESAGDEHRLDAAAPVRLAPYLTAQADGRELRGQPLGDAGETVEVAARRGDRAQLVQEHVEADVSRRRATR